MKKYFGVFVSVTDRVEGSLINRYFTTRKGPYDGESYGNLIEAKQDVYDERIRSGGDRDDPRNSSLAHDIAEMRKTLEMLMAGVTHV